MLEFMSQQALTPTPTNNSRMSLAILPSQPMAYSPSTTLLGPSPSPAKRPKLSLDTNNVPSIFGKASTSLRLDTLSAASPTSRNTFSNALNPAHAPSKRVRKPVLAISTGAASSDQSSAQPSQALESAESSATTATSVSSIESISNVVPYKLAFNTTSILVNSPIPRAPKRSVFSHPRPMFPAPKKVAFREPLTEDVRTTRFTLRHSDIESSTSTISTLDSADAAARTQDSAKKEKVDQSHEAGQRSKTAAPHAGDKRESSDEEDSDCPATPVAGRRKRHRQWVWTLPTSAGNNARLAERKEDDALFCKPVESHEERLTSQS
ncbi:hypothetical protein Slin14017_G013820 [Septoria linicola]|nr:hypothetical protein Slin14017_G013820 [Septoria linicola]